MKRDAEKIRESRMGFNDLEEMEYLLFVVIILTTSQLLISRAVDFDHCELELGANEAID